MAKASASRSFTPIEVATIPKSKRESVRVCLLQWSGENRIDIRVMSSLAKEAGVMVPTQKGLSFQVEHLAALRAALDEAAHRAWAIGWLKKDQVEAS